MEYELRRGGMRALVTDKGGELIGLWDGEGTQYIWEGDPQFWAGRNPNLFPIVGSLHNGSVRIGGGTYQMRRHGFARDKDFHLVQQAGDAVTLELTPDEDTLARYPFHFSFRVTHKLLDNGFSTTFLVRNAGEVPMPYCVGGHTVFRCPPRPGEDYDDYRLIFDQVEDVASPTITPQGDITFRETVRLLDGTDTLVPDHDRICAMDTFVFQGLKSTGVTLRSQKTGRGIRLDFPGFPMVAFWTVRDAPYLAMEPWHGCASLEGESGEFTQKPHCITLAPGEEKALTFTVTLV